MTGDPELPKQSGGERTKLETHCFQTSDSSTVFQENRVNLFVYLKMLGQYGKENWINELQIQIN